MLIIGLIPLLLLDVVIFGDDFTGNASAMEYTEYIR